MKDNKKDYFIRFRIDAVEKQRIERLTKVTRRQTSDLYRESLFQFIRVNHPEILIA